MLETKSLQFSYQKGVNFNFPDIQCSAGEHLLILGPSGCGKTTLLHLLSGILEPSAGQVLLNNENFSGQSAQQRDKVRGEQIGLIFQQNHLFRALTVEENIVSAAYFANNQVNTERLEHLLNSLGLASKREAKPNQLSQGQRQRVAIARALFNAPKLVFADEPTSSLDDKNCWEVISLLEQQIAESNAALIIVTHDQRLKTHFPKQLSLDNVYSVNP
jgi:ABC-type lipoprotein export system ATPase subunit